MSAAVEICVKAASGAPDILGDCKWIKISCSFSLTHGFMDYPLLFVSFRSFHSKSYAYTWGEEDPLHYQARRSRQ